MTKTKLKKIAIACLCFLMTLITVFSASFLKTNNNVVLAQETLNKDETAYYLKKSITPIGNNIYRADVEFNNKTAYGDMYVTLAVDMSASTSISDVQKMYKDTIDILKTKGTNIKVAVVFFGENNLFSSLNSGYKNFAYKDMIKQESLDTVGQTTFLVQSSVYDGKLTYNKKTGLPSALEATADMFKYTYYTVGGSDPTGFYDLNNSTDYNKIRALGDVIYHQTTGRSPYDIAWDRAYYRELSKVPVNKTQAMITIGDFAATWTKALSLTGATDNNIKRGAFNISRLIQNALPNLSMLNIMSHDTSRTSTTSGVPRAWELAKKTTTDRPSSSLTGYDVNTYADSSLPGSPWCRVSDDANYFPNFWYVKDKDKFSEIPTQINNCLLNNSRLKYFTHNEVVIHETLNPNFEVIRTDNNYPITCGFAKANNTGTYYTQQYVEGPLEYLSVSADFNDSVYSNLNTYTMTSSPLASGAQEFESYALVVRYNNTDQITAGIPFDRTVYGNGQTYAGEFNDRYKLTYYFRIKDNTGVTSATTVNTHILNTDEIISSRIINDGRMNTYVKSTMYSGNTKNYLPGMEVDLTPQYYTIAYNSNGGSGSMSSQQAVYGSNTTLKANTFTRNLHASLRGNGGLVNNKEIDTITTPANFLGWAESATGSKVYEDKATVGTIANPNETKTLYATWNARVTLPTPTRDNFIFEEWNSKADGTGLGYDAGDEVVITQDPTVFYAIWSAKTYKVKYDLNGGSGSTFNTPQTGTYGTGIRLYSAVPTKAGYTFEGWTLNNRTSFVANNVQYHPNDMFDITDQEENTLYAIWKSTITYNANGGTFVDNMTLTPETYTTYDDVRYTGVISQANYVNVDNAETPLRDGYTFEGWNTKANGTGTKVTGSIAPTTQTLYAQWKAVPTYTITYNANGGTGGPDKDIKTQNVPLDLSFTPAPTRTGYTFQGWSENSSATTPEYTSTERQYTKNSDATMYAVWKVRTYTIAYNANGGSGAPTSQTKTYDVNINLQSGVPTRDKYTFKGWATSATATTATYQPGQTYTNNANLRLYAVWEKTTYTVTYNYAENGGTSVTVASKKFDPDENFDPSPVATKAGWQFMGWSANKNSALLISSTFDMPEHDITVYAVYKKTITAYFSNNDTYTAKTKTDAPIIKTTDIYNKETYADFTGPAFTNIPGAEEYIEGQIADARISTNTYIPRNATLTSAGGQSTVRVTANEGSATFDGVYRTNISLYYDVNGGEPEIDDASKIGVYKTAGATNKTCIISDTPSYTITDTIPTREGYSFTGWSISNITTKTERCYAGDVVSATQYPDILLGDRTAYAQWLTGTITSKADDIVAPGHYIEYTVKAETSGGGNKVQFYADIPANTILVTEGLTLSSDGTKVIFTINNVDNNSTVSRTYRVKVNDNVASGTHITAGLEVRLDNKCIDSTTNTSKFVAPPVVNTVGYNYEVTYNMEPGETGTAPIDTNVYRGGMNDVATLMNNTLKKSGYTFCGWVDTDSHKVYREGDTVVVTKNLNFSALWGKIQHATVSPDKIPGSNISFIADIYVPEYLKSIDISDTVPKYVDVKNVTISPVITDNYYVTTRDEASSATRKTIIYNIDALAPFAPTTTIDNRTVVDGGTAFEPAPITENGYTIACWYIDDTYNGTLDINKVYNFNTPVNENKTLYAVWMPTGSINYRTVNFNMGSHGSPISPVKVANGTFVTAPSVPLDGKYYIYCWYKDSSFTDIEHIDPSKVVDFSQPITKDTTIYACWAEINTDDTNSHINTPVVTYKTAAGESDIVNIHLVKVPGISKYQVVISGIIDDNTAPGTTISNSFKGQTITGYAINSPLASTRLHYYFAYIVGPNYTKTTYSDGKTAKYIGEDVRFLDYYGARKTATARALPDDEATGFVEWNTRETGTGGTSVLPGSSVVIGNNRVVFAKFITIKQAVQNKRDDYIPDETYITVVTVKAPFTGSFDVVIEPKDGTELLSILNKTSSYFTDIKEEDGKFIATINGTEGTSYHINVNAKVTDGAVPGTQTGCDAKAIVKDKDFYANEDNINIGTYYTLTYDANGGTGTVPVDTTYYRQNETAKLASASALSNNGYEFGGWCEDTNGEGDVYVEGSNITMTKDTVVYAVWKTGAPLPFTGSQTIAVISAIALLSIGLYFSFKRKKIEA